MIQRAYKTELDPTTDQVRRLRHFSDVTRHVYNWALAKRKAAHEAGEPMPKSGALIAEFRAGRPGWTVGACSRCEETALDSLDKAYQVFFDICKGKRPKPPPSRRQDGPPGFPRFKRRRDGTVPVAFWGLAPTHVEDRRIRLQGLGWLRLKERGYIPTSGVKINRATVSEQAGRWFVSVQVEEETPTPKPLRNEGAVGVHLGVRKLVWASNGEEFDNPRALPRLERKLRRLQQEFSRRHAVCVRQVGETKAAFEARRATWAKSRNLKDKGDPMSANAEKTRQKIAALHYRIACVRRNAAQQATHRIVYHADPPLVITETLNVAGMMQNRKLAKAIADANMAEVLRELSYKADWNGAQVVKADRWFPSTKHCPACGAVKSAMRLSERLYVCEECGFTVERDHGSCLSLLTVAGKPPETLNAGGGEGSGLTAQAAG